MCNSQNQRSCPSSRNNSAAKTVAAANAANAANAAANAANTLDPMADVIAENPTCNFVQPSGEYVQTTPNAVPYNVTPSYSMPISVQPAGPGTPVYPSMQNTFPTTMPQTPVYNTTPYSAPLTYPTGNMFPSTLPVPQASQQLMPQFNQQVTSQLTENLPESLTNPAYVPGYLRENIGSLVRVEFLLTDNTTDRVGILREVGASFIILDSLDGASKLMCDLFSIRFVTIMQQITPDNYQTARTIYASNRFQG